MNFSVNNLLTYIGDIFFPPRADELVVRKLNQEVVNKYYNELKLGEITALSSYSEPNIKALIHEAKFHYNQKSYRLLGSLLEKALEPDNIYVPVPLSRERYKDREYNQVEEILRHTTNCNYRTDILVRIRNTPPQTSLKKSERLTNISGAFLVQTKNLKSIEPNFKIVVVDDVSTTGTTLKEAIKTLRASTSLPVSGLALAH